MAINNKLNLFCPALVKIYSLNLCLSKNLSILKSSLFSVFLLTQRWMMHKMHTAFSKKSAQLKNL
ncbi:MAG: hypothetical protein CTY18_03980 [Methylomonas sp.]|nr:MAG: hypothetical protein CTY24_08665 [Methylobacter sp.]PPD36539.1 MAG: hypothetical protein CTY18_03980 [Methylomonas sp.]